MHLILSESSALEHKCNKCDFKSKYKHSIVKHELAIHLKVKYYCDFCDYKATQKTRLNFHRKTEHWKEIISFRKEEGEGKLKLEEKEQNKE